MESDLHIFIFLVNGSCQAAGKNHTNQLVSWRVIYTDSYSLRMDLAKQQAKTTPINWNKDNVVVSLLTVLY